MNYKCFEETDFAKYVSFHFCADESKTFFSSPNTCLDKNEVHRCKFTGDNTSKVLQFRNHLVFDHRNGSLGKWDLTRKKLKVEKTYFTFVEKTIAFHSDQLQGIGHVICATRDRFVCTVRGILTAVFKGMQNTNIAKDAKDYLKISKVFRHRYTDPQVHKSSSLKKVEKKEKQ